LKWTTAGVAAAALLWLSIPIGVMAQTEPDGDGGETPAEAEATEADEAGGADEAETQPQVSYPIALSGISAPLEPGLIEPGADPVQVMVQTAIDEEGLVTDVAVAASCGNETIDATALRAVRALTFFPAMADGVPVAVTIEYPIVFLAPVEMTSAGLPAELSGHVEVRGTMAPVAEVEVALFAASPRPPDPEDEDEDEELDPDDFVAAEEPLAVVTTDEEGRFLFTEIPPGTYMAVMGHAGFKREQFVEVLPEGAVREVVYRIRPTGIAQTVVVARKENDSPERVLTRDELRKIPGAGGDPMAAVASLPGVVHTAPSFTAGDQVQAPVLRGAAAEDSVLYLDGLPVPIIFHTMSNFSIVTDDLVERVYLKPAAVDARFGDLTGGVVGLDLRSPRKDRIGGFIDPGIGMASFAIEGPISKKSRFYTGMRRSYYDILMRLVWPKDSPIEFATAPFFHDQQLILETDAADWLTLNFGYIGTLDGMELLDTEEEEESPLIFSMRTDMHRLYLRGAMKNQRGVTNRVQPAITFWKNSFEFSDFMNTEDRHTTFHLIDDLHVPLFDGLDVDAGVLLEVDKLTSTRNVPPSSREDTGQLSGTYQDENLVGVSRDTRTWLGGYVSLPIKPIKQITIAPEFRLDYFSSLNEVVPQVRGRVGAAPHENVRLSVAGGRYMQSPSFSELDATTGNPELGPEGAWHLNGGVLWAPGPWLDIDLQAYMKWQDHQTVSSNEASDWSDLAQWEDLFTDEEEDPTHGLSNSGVGRIYGLELFARFEVVRRVKLNGWLGYSLSWAERKDFPDEEWRYFQHDRRHQITALLQVTFPGEIGIGARWQFQSGAPRTPVEDAIFYADWSMFIPTYGELYSARGLPYHQLDLRLDKRFRKKNHLVDIYIDVTNVYAATASDWELYSYDYRETASFTGIPTINFAVRVEF